MAASLAVFAIACWTLYPGWYSFDSAWLLLQARSGDYSDLQPPMMALLWSGLLALGAAPGALLLLHLMMASAGLLLLGAAARRLVAVLLPLLLLWPPFLALFGHLWVDVALAAAMLLGAGLLAAARERPHLAWYALLPLAWAVAVRHNGLPAVLPLLLLAVSRAPRAPPGKAARLLLATAFAATFLFASLALSRMLVPLHTPAWTPTAVWDLSAASIARGRVLLPAGMIGPALDVAELAALTDPDTSMTLIAGSRSGINVGISAPMPDPVLHELRRRWLLLPFTDTRAWLDHRAAVAWSLFGPQRRDKTADLMIVPRVTPMQDNPPIVANQGAANAALARTIFDWRDSPLLMPLAYLLASLGALAWSLRRRFAGDRQMVVALVASAWLYALPLVLIVPSAEWRYTLWPMLASACATLLAARR